MTGNDLPPTPRVLTLEDVQRLVGALTLEVDQLRRENALLREYLTRPVVAPLESHGVISPSA